MTPCSCAFPKSTGLTNAASASVRQIDWSSNSFQHLEHPASNRYDVGASMFSGAQGKCASCGKTAYPLEKATVGRQTYHKSCFKCEHGGCPITPSNQASLEGILYCKHHFASFLRRKEAITISSSLHQ